MTTFGTFLRAVWGDSLARMSGPASVPFTGLALYVDQATSKALWVGLAILCFVTTCYRVWLREHRLLAQLTNALPRIVFCEVRSDELYSQAPSKEFIVQAWFKNIPTSPDRQVPRG